MTDPRCPIHGTVFVNGTSASCTCAYTPPPAPDLPIEKKYMETGEHHWRDGWYFKRLEGGDVRVRSPMVGGRDAVLIIPAAEWASIVAHVSKWGEQGDSYQAALTFHGSGDRLTLDSREVGPDANPPISPSLRRCRGCAGTDKENRELKAELTRLKSPDLPVENSPRCPTCGNVAEEWGCCSNSFHIPRPVENSGKQTCTNCDHPVSDHCGVTENGCSCCDGPASVENSELREALEPIRELARRLPDVEVSDAANRIEELFASLLQQYYELQQMASEEVLDLKAEISRLRADQITPEEARTLWAATHRQTLVSAEWMIARGNSLWKELEAKIVRISRSGSQ